MALDLKLTDHPVLEKPTEEELVQLVLLNGEEEVAQYLADREQLIHLEKSDPYNHRRVLPHWKDAAKLLDEKDQVLISGGNRSGKTAFSSWYIMHLLEENPGARVACFSMTHQSSIRDQQPAVWEVMPNAYKQMKRGKVADIKFTQKNGFTGETFILPKKDPSKPGSQCWFNAYQQPLTVLEGFEADAIWFDEEVPWSWYETAAFRLVTRRGKMIVSATPVTGYTPVYSNFVNGARVVESRPSPLLPDRVNVPGCPVGHMPYVMECMDDSKGVIFFFTEMNPYNPYDQMEKTLSGESSTQVKVRAYGYTDKSSGNFFPKFGKDHIVEPDQIPKSGTNYHVVDPAGSRQWSQLWMRVTEDGIAYVYRDWPDRKTYGEWAVPGDKPEGDLGPAQKSEGIGLNEYKQKILELEGDEIIWERMIDPRAGGSKAVTEEGGETLIDLLDDGEIPMSFAKAPGLPIEQGISAINEWLNYNQEEKITVLNQPKLYISSECENLIDCMKEYTAAGGEKNRYKDFVDCLRYLMTYDPIYVDKTTFKATGGGSYL